MYLVPSSQHNRIFTIGANQILSLPSLQPPRASPLMEPQTCLYHQFFLDLLSQGYVLYPSPKQCPGRLLYIVGQNPNVSKSSRLEVIIFQFLNLLIQGIFYICPAKLIGEFLEVVNFNQLFLKLNQFIYNFIVGYPRSLLQSSHIS